MVHGERPPSSISAICWAPPAAAAAAATECPISSRSLAGRLTCSSARRVVRSLTAPAVASSPTHKLYSDPTTTAARRLRRRRVHLALSASGRLPRSSASRQSSYGSHRSLLTPPFSNARPRTPPHPTERTPPPSRPTTPRFRSHHGRKGLSGGHARSEWRLEVGNPSSGERCDEESCKFDRPTWIWWVIFPWIGILQFSTAVPSLDSSCGSTGPTVDGQIWAGHGRAEPGPTAWLSR